jgi:hypothetical protein
MVNTNNIRTLIKKISDADNILKRSKEGEYSTEININDDDWLEKAKRLSEEFKSVHANLMEKISRQLLFSFKAASDAERKLIWNALAKTEYLNDYLDVPNDKRTFENQLLMLIIKDLGFDTRDALLDLNHLIDLEKRKKIDYKGIINQLLPFADGYDKHGMGSMKSILLNVINN